MTTIP